MAANFSPDPSVQEPTPHHAAVAEALSFLIREKTSGEAAFAILGHWGRGKSFIAKSVGKRLDQTHATMIFSSWQYPNRPESLVSSLCEGEEAQLGDADRADLVNALFDAVKEKFKVKESLEVTARSLLTSDRVSQMRILARYVA